MANPNAPFGFRVERNQNGDFPRVRPYTSSSSVNIGTGAVCNLNADGTVSVWGGTALNRNKLIGVANTPVKSTDTDRTVFIADNPAEEFVVQCDDKSVTNINALIGRFFAGASMTSRNSTLNQSISVLDASSGTSVNNSTTLAVFQGIRFHGEIQNERTQSFVRVVVRINPINHILGNATTGN